jgi:CRP-like cAMP-binding protein
MDIQAALKRTSLLSDLPQDTYAALAKIARRVHCEEGDILYNIGDPARDVFVMVSGRVRFSIGVGSRPESGASIFSAGDTIGWAALLNDQPRRIATAVCLEDSDLIALDGAQLLAIFDSRPDAGYLVMRRLAKWIARDFLDQSTMLNSA